MNQEREVEHKCGRRSTVGESHKSTGSLGEAVKEEEEGRTGGNCEEEKGHGSGERVE
jgi:hypothetical protein